MSRFVALALVPLFLGLPLVAAATEPGEVSPPAEPSQDEAGLRTTWSVTLTGQYTEVDSPEDDDDVGGFFDQYEFTPNKSSSFPFEIGIRDGAVDVLGEKDTAIFQARLASPTSNLGVSGSQADDPFFNQRLDALFRLEGLAIDFDYRRIRTEQLRLFPDTVGRGLVFHDQTRADDRFYRDRTGLAGELRLRPYQAFDLGDEAGSWLSPELSLRGGYEDREANQQLRIHRDPSNDWLGLRQDQDRSLSQVGGGLLLAPDGLLTVSFDFDHERLRFDSPIRTEGGIGYPPPESSRTIGFVPDTDRSTGTIRFNSRIGDRAVVEGGFQVSELEQVGDRTPDQDSAGLRGNSVRTYSANAAVDVVLVEALSFNAFFKFDRRDNDIDRGTALFNDSNGTQVDPFVDDWQRFFVGGEIAWALPGANRVALGLRYEDVDRDLDFAEAGGLRILPATTVIDQDSRIVTLYGRTTARPWRRLSLNGELGYRWAPKTGYASDLDDNVYGSLRASYVFALSRPLVLSAYVRGENGENDDFSLVSGQGAEPAGPRLSRSFKRWNVVSGLTASISPVDPLGLYASFYYSENDQRSSFDLSNLQRYWQDNVPITFVNDGRSRFENRQVSLSLGSHLQIDEQLDAGLSYAYTWAKADYAGSNTSVPLDLISDTSVVDSDTHAVDFEVGYWIRDGLRVLAGYRYQHYNDDAPVVQSVASAVSPYDRSTHQHTVTLGITLTNELFARAP